MSRFQTFQLDVSDPTCVTEVVEAILQYQKDQFDETEEHMAQEIHALAEEKRDLQLELLERCNE